MRGWAFSEIEIGARFKLLDTFGWPERPEPPPEAEATGPPPPPHALPEGDGPQAEGDTTGVADPLELAQPPVDDEDPDFVPAQPEDPRARTPVEAAETVEQVPLDRPGIRFRTTIGARYRFPLSSADKDPYLDPDFFLQQPIGSGQADIQLELNQDVAFGQRFLAVAGVTYGLQLKDELVRRVAPPGQPYGYASQKTTVSRDMGDYLEIVISPRFAITEAMSLAVEYTFWNKGDDVYQTTSGGVDASPLNAETSQTLHMLGIGAYYRTTRLFAAGRAGMPIDLAFLWQTPISGSGGQTPALGVVNLSIRVPVQLF